MSHELTLYPVVRVDDDDENLCAGDCPWGRTELGPDAVQFPCVLFGPRAGRQDLGPGCLGKPGGADPVRPRACREMTAPPNSGGGR